MRALPAWTTKVYTVVSMVMSSSQYYNCVTDSAQTQSKACGNLLGYMQAHTSCWISLLMTMFFTSSSSWRSDCNVVNVNDILSTNLASNIRSTCYKHYKIHSQHTCCQTHDRTWWHAQLNYLTKYQNHKVVHTSQNSHTLPHILAFWLKGSWQTFCKQASAYVQFDQQSLERKTSAMSHIME